MKIAKPLRSRALPRAISVFQLKFAIRALAIVVFAAVCVAAAFHHRGGIWLLRNGHLPPGAASAVSAAAFPDATDAGTFTTFSVPDAGTGVFEGTIAININASGDITGTYMNPASVFHGFVRSADGAIAVFDAPNGGPDVTQGTIPVSINSAGDVTGFYLDSSDVSHGFLRTATGALTVFDAPGASAAVHRGTSATSINDAGEIAGFYATGSSSTTSTYHGFVRAANGKFTTLDEPHAGAGEDPDTGRKQGTEALAINAAGEIAGSYIDSSSDRHGFVRSASGVYAEFDPPGASTSTTVSHGGLNGTLVAGIDSAGDVEGTYTDSSGLRHGFVRMAGGAITTFDPSGAGANTGLIQGTFPHGIDPEGEHIAGLYTDTSGEYHGFVRNSDGIITTFEAPTAGGASSSMIPGTGAGGVNGDGQVAGTFADAKGVFHGFLLTPTPVAQVAAPKFSLAAGTYTSPQTLKLTDKTPQTAIYYTLNGAAPTNKSTRYTAAIALSKTTTVKAIAEAAGFTNSAVVTVLYKIVKPQTIALTPPKSPVIYGVKPIALTAKASSGLAVLFSVISGPAKVSGHTLTVTGAGTVIVAANQAGNAAYAPAREVKATIVVQKAKLTVTANNLTMTKGAKVPALTYKITGFVNGDTQAKATTGQPKLTTTATSTSVTGSYPIKISAGTLVAKSYVFTFMNGQMKVK